MTHPFITHNGGPCPVSPETVVDVKFADGRKRACRRAHLWSFGRDWWQWQGRPANNIIAYRLHQPDKGEAS